MDAPCPFTPTFGMIPPYLAGRRQIIDAMRRALVNGPGDPNLSSIVVGARGTGKTALLTCIAGEAEAAGWIVANTSATPGMLDDILERATEAASELVGAASDLRVSGVSVGQLFGIEFDRDEPARGNWRTRMNALFKQLEPYGTGLLITVDEVKARLDEMVQLVSVYQHFVREGKRVALVMAGLPSNVSDLLSHESTTFLRRARQHHLGRVGDADVRSAFRKTVEGAGASIDDAALDAAVEAIDGFPYMMQLVGYWSWVECEGPAVDAAAVRRGAGLAEADLRDGVLAATYRELSEVDRRFLAAMLQDSKESTLADVAQRMGVKSNYASKYKERLLESGVIGDRGHGHYTIDLPAFRPYLRERLEEDGLL
jgi:hypothetical protein